MSDEIAEFLRRAALRRAEQMQQQVEQQRRSAQQQQQFTPPPVPLTRSAPMVVEAEIVDDDDDDRVQMPSQMSRVSQSVARHLDTRGFSERADRLGDASEQADERMDMHVHEAFDHRLGTFDGGSQSIKAAINPEIDNEMRSRIADDHPLLNMLRNPQSIRNAIIISELLQRPEKNW